MTKQNKFKLMLGLGVATLIIALASVLKALFVGTASAIGIFVMGFTAFTFAPLFMAQITAWKFKSLNFMVSRDPINHWIGVQSRRWKAIEEARLGLIKKGAAVLAYKRNCEKMVKDWPDKKDELALKLKAVEQRFAIGVTAYVNAKKNYEETNKKIEYMEAEYDNACAEWEVGNALGTLDNFMDDLIERSAIKAINQKSDESFAQMQMAMVDAHADGIIEQGVTIHAVNYSSDGQSILLGNILDPIKAK